MHISQCCFIVNAKLFIINSP
uniref:Uncharacterized protein n=1 Tax=Anguilla anguilla TaxID=7936 RepID=A0A0E9QV82_ANGAN